MITQDMLNVTTRNEMDIDILMFVQDKNISVSKVVANDENQYAKTSSIVVLDRYAPQPMATLERNEYLLDGSFFNPAVGTQYDTYMSDSMSDDNGEFAINPIITLTLNNSSVIKYVSVILNSYISTAYPKKLIMKLFDSNNNTLATKTIAYEEMTNIPNVVFSFNGDIGISNVKTVTLEYVGTQVPHRRARLTQIMFGKLLTFNHDMLINPTLNSKSSYVADSIPSKTFTFGLINYDKLYNVDNPNSDLPDITKDTDIAMHWIYYNDGILEYSPMEHFKLSEITTNGDNTVTFECDSILDMLTVEYDRDNYTGIRTVNTIITQLLIFAGLPRDTIILDGDYGSVEINRPIPSAPIREILQQLAFAIGATILILDSGKIRFANLDLDASPKTKLSYNNLLSIPAANQLNHTHDLTIVKYNTIVEEEPSQIITATLTTIKSSITYSAAKDMYLKSVTGGTVLDIIFYAEHAEITVDFAADSSEVIVELWGKRCNIKSSIDKTATDTTLKLDSALCYKADDNLKNKYINWYSKKYKYTANTRGEPLIKAGDIITLQSPFSDNLKSYVLANNMSFGDTLSGDIELIALNR